MCDQDCLKFGQENIDQTEVFDKNIIEVGSYNVNGSLKPYVMSLKPKSYVGVDLTEGPNVDTICPAEKIIEKFGKESFEGLISTEMLEHVENWQLIISNFKNIIKPNGWIIITTRSKGFRLHNYPTDYWRYEESDVKTIFSDFIIKKIEKDTIAPGIFVKAVKPEKFIETDLNNHQLFSILSNKSS